MWFFGIVWLKDEFDRVAESFEQLKLAGHQEFKKVIDFRLLPSPQNPFTKISYMKVKTLLSLAIKANQFVISE